MASVGEGDLRRPGKYTGTVVLLWTPLKAAGLVLSDIQFCLRRLVNRQDVDPTVAFGDVELQWSQGKPFETA